MKFNIIVIAIVSFAILAGVGILATKQKAEPPISESISEKTVENPQKDQQFIDAPVDTRYVEYSSSILNQSADKKRVLFFYANWCPTCRPTDANISEQQSRIPEDIIVIRVNYNDSDTDQSEKDLAAKYGITYQHTFVQIDSQGNEVAKWNGGQTDELLNNVK